MADFAANCEHAIAQLGIELTEINRFLRPRPKHAQNFSYNLLISWVCVVGECSHGNMVRFKRDDNFTSQTHDCIFGGDDLSNCKITTRKSRVMTDQKLSTVSRSSESLDA